MRTKLFWEPSISDIFTDILIQPTGINYTDAKEVFKWHVRSQLISGYNSFTTLVIYININCSVSAGLEHVGQWRKLVCPEFIVLFAKC
jgi:hypothetical protein